MEIITRKTRIAVKHFHTVNMLAGKCDFEILLPVQIGNYSHWFSPVIYCLSAWRSPVGTRVNCPLGVDAEIEITVVHPLLWCEPLQTPVTAESQAWVEKVNLRGLATIVSSCSFCKVIIKSAFSYVVLKNCSVPLFEIKDCRCSSLWWKKANNC